MGRKGSGMKGIVNIKKVGKGVILGHIVLKKKTNRFLVVVYRPSRYLGDYYIQIIDMRTGLDKFYFWQAPTTLEPEYTGWRPRRFIQLTDTREPEEFKKLITKFIKKKIKICTKQLQKQKAMVIK